MHSNLGQEYLPLTDQPRQVAREQSDKVHSAIRVSQDPDREQPFNNVNYCGDFGGVEPSIAQKSYCSID